jgi:hypothetical protein
LVFCREQIGLAGHHMVHTIQLDLSQIVQQQDRFHWVFTLRFAQWGLIREKKQGGASSANGTPQAKFTL